METQVEDEQEQEAHGDRGHREIGGSEQVAQNTQNQEQEHGYENESRS